MKKQQKKNFTKPTHMGISLIVLIITIIVIIILSTAVIVTISNNNPIDEANMARYETDRDSMQAIFTNTVAKVMVKNQGTVNVVVGQINSVTSGVKRTTGEVRYKVTDAINSENSNGKIIFDKGENTDTVFYTGKQLPIYTAGETKWHVDSEGTISLEVAGYRFGNEEEVLQAGAYDEYGVMLASWDELVNDYGLDISSDYTNSTYKTSAGSMYSVLNNNEELSSATKIIIDNDITNIGNYVFMGCSNLTNIIMPDTLTSISMGSFQGCTGLTSITIPETVTSIGNYAFQTCSGLKSIIIPDSITSIGAGAFNGCKSLTSITIPEKVTSIESFTFSGCISLTNITIPDLVTNIGLYAFYGCSGLTSIEIPENVTSIGSRAFADCNSLTNIKVNENNTVYDSRENCNAIIETATNTLIAGCNSTTIKNTVKSIGEYAFSWCRRFETIMIPESVTTINAYAFYTCEGLKSIEIPETVTSIGNYAFSYCSELKTIYYKGTATGSPWGTHNAIVIAE